MVTLLAACAVVQVACIGFFSKHLAADFVAAPRPRVPLEASIQGLFQILGGRVIASPLVGPEAAASLTSSAAVVALGAIGVVGMYVAVRSGPSALRVFILFGLGILVLALADPLDAWPGLAQAPAGERYFVIPELAVLAAVVWAAGRGRPRLIRVAAVTALVVVTLLVIPREWRFPPLEPTGFPDRAQAFEHAKPGTVTVLALNPFPWKMALTKH
jgi:hypothetical protein